jgi:hypothetical protein
MKETIFDLWYGNIDPVESSGKITPEIKRILNESEESYEMLTDNLDEKEKELLEKHLDIYSSLHCEYTAKAFVDGFSLGVKLITEALK